MKIFISSVMAGFGAERQAVVRAVRALRYEPIMAEDFGAQPNSPQVACLGGVRGSDIVVLVMGERYGSIPPGSTISATHQEYRDARGAKQVLAFVQDGITPESEQSAFIDEVQGWEDGLFRAGFSSPENLQDGVTRALHDLALMNAVGQVDERELLAKAVALIPSEGRNQSTSTYLDLAVVGGPTQRILRPVQLEAATLAEHLQQTAMFGEHRLFDRTKGSESRLDGADLVVRQERGSAIRLTEQGSLVLRLALDEPEPSGRTGFNPMSGSMVIVEEDVQRRLATALAFAAATIEEIDPTQRLTHLAVAARIAGAEYRAWRTRAQNAANPTSVQINMMSGGERPSVAVSIRRAALRLDRTSLIEDILVPLRRQFPAG